MPITLIEYSKRLQGVVNYLQGNEFGNTMGQMGSEALTLIRKRVTETGKNAEGGSFPPYSTKPMLIGSKNMTLNAFNKIAGSKTKRKELAWVTISGHKLFEIPGGYKQFRELHGRQTGFVDFVMSGRMWSNIKLVSDRSELNTGVAVIRATTDLDKKKLAGNTEREGEILALSKTELQRITDIYEKGIEDAFRRNKLL